jgi:hypothetical protein
MARTTRATGQLALEPQAIKPPANQPKPERVRDISEAVYKMRLSPADLAKMLARDGPEKLRERAGAYDALTRVYLRAIAGDLLP